MAPDSMPGTSIHTVAVPGTANLTQPTAFADQSQSRLMALPKELRNEIYDYVFSDSDFTCIYEPFVYQREDLKADKATSNHDTLPKYAEVKMVHVPRPVRLDRTTPPSDNYILPCRQLYCEMKQMYTAANRAYWTENRFLFADLGMAMHYATGSISPPPFKDMAALPVDRDMTRIREVLIVLHPKYRLRLAINELTWRAWLLPSDAKWSCVCDSAPYVHAQCVVDIALIIAMGRWVSPDPCAREGLTRDMLGTISRLECIHRAIKVMQDLVGDDEHDEHD